MTDIKENPQNLQETGKTTLIRTVALSIILAVALIFLIVMYLEQRSKSVQMETMLTHEKDSLANELRLMVIASDTLKTSNDSLRTNLSREREKIVQLLKRNASNVYLINQFKKEINTMREIMKSYIVQIDSLNTRNKSLVAENTEIRNEITQVRHTNVELEKTKEELNTKVEIASVIQAKNIVASPLNRKRKETNRISQVENLRVCFSLRENAIAQAGPKEVFMRVIRPDSLVITNSPDNLFDYRGNKLIFSASRTADYMKQDLEMCIYLANTGDFITGNYSVELYLENNIIGRTTFMLARE